MGWIKKKLVELCLFIDTIIYNFTSFSYRVFSLVCGISLFDEDGNSIIATITNRIYVILGVVMLFVLAYEILKNIANPDGISSSDDTSVKGIAKNAIIALAILAFSPVAFKYMSVFQNNIIKQNVIGNIILGSTTETEDDYIDSAGLRIAISVFSTFYHPAQDDMTSCKDMISDYDDDKPLDPDDFEGDRAQLCAEYINAANRAEQNVSFKYFSEDEELNSKVYDYTMDYSPVLSAIAGAIACYMFLSYAIDAGKRVAKLAFYEIIAPIPIICKIFKPSVFNKWLKDITKTYVELFTRLAIVFFAVYLISIIPELNVFQSGDHTGGVIVVAFANCIIILGLLAFAKEAPKLLEDLLEIKIGEVKIKKKLQENDYAQRAIGMGAGALQGAFGRAHKRKEIAEKNGENRVRKTLSTAGGFIGGALGGARRGWNGNYSNGLRAGIENAHDENMNAGANRDAARERGRNITGTNAGGINSILGGAMNLRNEIESGATSLWDRTTGNNSRNAAENLESLKNLNNLRIDSNPKASDIKNVKDAKNDFLQRYRAGEFKENEAIQRLENAGFEISYDELEKLQNKEISMEKIINDKYKEKIKELRVSGIQEYDAKQAEKMAKLDSEELLAEFSKFSGSSGLSSTEIKDLQTQIGNLSSLLEIDATTGKISDASAREWVEKKEKISADISKLATKAKVNNISSGNKSDKK